MAMCRTTFVALGRRLVLTAAGCLLLAVPAAAQLYRPCTDRPAVKPPTGPCYGYHHTQWKPWPAECPPGCPTCWPTESAIPSEVIPGEAGYPESVEGEMQLPPPPSHPTPAAVTPLPPTGPAADEPAADEPPAAAPAPPETLLDPLPPAAPYLDEPATPPAPDANWPMPPVPGTAPPLPDLPDPDAPADSTLPDDSPAESLFPESSPTTPPADDSAGLESRLQRLPQLSLLAERAPLFNSRAAADVHPSLWSQLPALGAASVAARPDSAPLGAVGQQQVPQRRPGDIAPPGSEPRNAPLKTAAHGDGTRTE